MLHHLRDRTVRVPREGADMTLPPTSLPNGITPRLLTRKQAANYLNLKPETFDEWRRQGKAPGPVPGHRTAGVADKPRDRFGHYQIRLEAMGSR